MAGNAPRRKKLRKLIAREYSASLMNDTKWTRLLTELRGLRVKCRAKFITDSEVSAWDNLAETPANYIELPIACGPYLVLEIEYLEIDSKESSAEVETVLNSLRVPHSRHGEFIRIVGHVRRQQRS